MRTCTLTRCNDKHYCKGYCRRHYQRWLRNGTTKRKKTHMRHRPAGMSKLDVVLFEFKRAKRNPKTGCLLTRTGLTSAGYGTTSYEGKRQQFIHRMALEVFMDLDSIPDGFQANHVCDNASCINPYHLYLGTKSDNVQDAIASGDHNNGDPKYRQGSKHPMSLLNEQIVRRLRRKYARLGSLFNFVKEAERYAVSHHTIRNIIKRKSWKHVK